MLLLFLLITYTSGTSYSLLKNYELLSITSASTSTYGPLSSFSFSGTLSEFSIFFFIKVTTWSGSSSNFVKIGNFALATSSSQVKLTVSSSITISVSSSKVINNWCLFLASQGSSGMALYVITEDSDYIYTTSTSPTPSSKYVKTTDSVVIGGASTRGYIHSFYIQNSHISSQYPIYVLFNYLHSISFLKGSYYAIKVFIK